MGCKPVALRHVHRQENRGSLADMKVSWCGRQPLSRYNPCALRTGLQYVVKEYQMFAVFLLKKEGATLHLARGYPSCRLWGSSMRALIVFQFLLLVVSPALSNQITNGYVLQVHSDGRVVNVPLTPGRQPLVGISMPGTHILTIGVSVCCNYSSAEVFTLFINHQRLTQKVFIGCSDPECPVAVGFFVPAGLRDHPYESRVHVSLEDGTSQDYRFRFVDRHLK